MRSGTLRHRIVIQQPAQTANAYGEVDGWADLVTLWSDVKHMGMQEAGQTRDARASTTEFVIRYRTDITPTMQVVWNGDEYDIESIGDMEGRRRSLTIRGVARS